MFSKNKITDEVEMILKKRPWIYAFFWSVWRNTRMSLSDLSVYLTQVRSRIFKRKNLHSSSYNDLMSFNVW